MDFNWPLIQYWFGCGGGGEGGLFWNLPTIQFHSRTTIKEVCRRYHHHLLEARLTGQSDLLLVAIKTNIIISRKRWTEPSSILPQGSAWWWRCVKVLIGLAVLRRNGSGYDMSVDGCAADHNMSLRVCRNFFKSTFQVSDKVGYRYTAAQSVCDFVLTGRTRQPKVQKKLLIDRQLCRTKVWHAALRTERRWHTKNKRCTPLTPFPMDDDEVEFPWISHSAVQQFN